MITTFFMTVSLVLLDNTLPIYNPIAIKGISNNAAFNMVRFMIPVNIYKMILNVFSIKKTMHKLPLNSF